MMPNDFYATTKMTQPPEQARDTFEAECRRLSIAIDAAHARANAAEREAAAAKAALMKIAAESGVSSAVSAMAAEGLAEGAGSAAARRLFELERAAEVAARG